MRTLLLSLALAGLVATPGVQALLSTQEQPQGGPSIDDVLNLHRVGAPSISPDGQFVAYTVRETNWDDNAFETEIWLADVGAKATRQMTNAAKSSVQPAWSPDGAWLTFISDRSGTRQIYRIATSGGEAEKLTSAPEGVTAFAWAPDSARLAYTMTDATSEAIKERDKKYGEMRFEDLDRKMAHLYLFDVAAKAAKPLTTGAFVVGSFDWSPDGTRIAFDHRTSSDPADGGLADISVLTVATGERRALVTASGPDADPKWSPDGSRLAFTSAMGKPFFYFQNSVIAVVPAEGGRAESLTDAFDENPNLTAWNRDGIFFAASRRTWGYLYKLDPASKVTARLAVRDQWIGNSFSLTPDGRSVAFVGADAASFPDVYVAPVAATLAAVKLSDTGAQIAAWPKHARETVQWKSKDGAEIEGVLHKPADFKAGQRHPLLVVIHGGPTGVSRPTPYTSGSGYYPIDMWLARGALVLEPNYRGSAGYGEKFRSLNVRNLGIGDAWDVLSGIDHLVAAGLVDGSRVGAMGWSQGGYISAFLTTRHADRFRALSVGAGISDWMTYYVNTDIHPFTRQYLKATPWDDPKIYADTSPMTYIKQAKTPTLIQHGELDQRVPIPNALELYQGLRDQNVPVELVIFKGFGHGLTKPKANRGAMQQNYDWFTKHVWAATTNTQQ